MQPPCCQDHVAIKAVTSKAPAQVRRKHDRTGAERTSQDRRGQDRQRRSGGRTRLRPLGIPQAAMYELRCAASVAPLDFLTFRTCASACSLRLVRTRTCETCLCARPAGSVDARPLFKQFVPSTAFQTICPRHRFSKKNSNCVVPNALATCYKECYKGVIRSPRWWLLVLLLPSDGSTAFQTICPKHGFPNNLSQALRRRVIRSGIRVL